MKFRAVSSFFLVLAFLFAPGMAFTAFGQTSRRTRKKPTTTTAKQSAPAAKPVRKADPQEQSVWDSIKDSHNPEDFRAYLTKYGESGTFAVTANACLKRIESERQAAEARLRALKIDFVWIEPGTFAMGTAQGGDADERPVHQVTISHGFFIGKYEVTQAQWRAVMDQATFQFRSDGTAPAENVTYDDVQEFIRRMNTRNDGFIYRLPTEAEWSYAADAGGHHAAAALDEMAWYGPNAGGRTHPVGAKQANAWGLYDVHGNVWEWVQDWYDKTYYRRSPDTDPLGPEAGELRGMRGGGWNSLANLCRIGLRNGLAPNLRRADLGFRLVRIPNTPTAGAPPTTTN